MSILSQKSIAQPQEGFEIQVLTGPYAGWVDIGYRKSDGTFVAIFRWKGVEQSVELQHVNALGIPMDANSHIVISNP